MSLARLAACFGGGGPRDAEWGNSGHLGHMVSEQAAGHRSDTAGGSWLSLRCALL